MGEVLEARDGHVIDQIIHAFCLTIGSACGNASLRQMINVEWVDEAGTVRNKKRSSLSESERAYYPRY
jgi:DNA-binding GntR family transcriptional regulator